MNNLKLSDIKVKLPFNIQKNMCIGHLMDWKDGVHKYGYKIDFDVYLPSKGIDLQREFCWTLEQKQALILSVIKGVDIQTFSVILHIDDARNKRDSTIKFIDGKQRFSTLLDFIQDKFPINLLGKDYLYSELPDYDTNVRSDYMNSVKYEIDHFSIHLNQTYEYSDQLISDDMKIAWFEQINFAGTPQDINHLKKLKGEIKSYLILSDCGANETGNWCLRCLDKSNCKLYNNK